MDYLCTIQERNGQSRTVVVKGSSALISLIESNRDNMVIVVKCEYYESGN